MRNNISVYILPLLCVVCSAVYARPDGSSLPQSDDSNNNYNNGENKDYIQEGSQNSEAVEVYGNDNINNNYDNVNTGEKNYHKSKMLTKVIPQPQDPQRLDEIYHEQGLNNYNKNEQKKEDNTNQTILVYWKFPRDCSKADPRNRQSSLVRFRGVVMNQPGNMPADGGVFQCKSKNNEYGSGENVGYEENGGGHLTVTSVPFSKLGYKQAFVNAKQNFAVGPQERILLRGKISCETIDAGKGPFNKTEVSRLDDDPRLASCQLQMTNSNGSNPHFYFLVINKSVWAVYDSDTFVAKRKVGERERYDGAVDLGIELDRRQAAVNYYLNGYLVWSIPVIGLPPTDDGITKIDLGSSGSASLVTLTSVSFAFGTGDCLDESDPYQPNNKKRLVRVLPASDPYYGANAMFYDQIGTVGNQTWGQGAKMKMYKLLLVRAASKPLAQPGALPGVYGTNINTAEYNSFE